MSNSNSPYRLEQDLDKIIARDKAIWHKISGSRIFITGGTGFFGRWLLASILHANRILGTEIEAFVLSRNTKRFLRNHPDFASCSDLKFLDGDIRSFSFPPGRFNAVIHAATDTGPDAAADPDQLTDCIVNGTRRVLEFSQQAGVTDLLYISSGAIYGEQPWTLSNLSEEYAGTALPETPHSAYGLGKRLAEHLCFEVGRAGRIRVKTARGFAFVGPYMSLDTHFAIGNFIADVLSCRPIIIRGDGTPVRSYLYAADMTTWLWRILYKGKAGQAYNLGSDKTISIKELAERIMAALDTETEIKVLSNNNTNLRSRYIPDISRAREELDLDCWTSLDESIRRTAAFYRKQ